MKKIIKQWFIHIKEFPIMVGIGEIPYQVKINTKEEFLLKILENLDKDIYVSVHSVNNRERNVYNTLYFDLDNKNLEIALKDAKIFNKWLVKKKYNHRIYFSGSKGFAFYIDFKHIIIKDYRDRMLALLDLLEQDLGIISFDRGVCSDPKRISRLPFTINTKSENLCMPIDNIQTFSFDHINEGNISIKISNFGKNYSKFTYKKKEQQQIVTHSDINTDLSYILKHASNIKDGAKNLIWRIIIPAMAVLGANDIDIIDKCQQFIKETHTELNTQTKNYILAQLRSYRNRTTERFIYPMRLDNFRGQYDLVGI